MSLYAIKNDCGEWLGWEVYQDDPEFICGGGSVWTDLDKAKFYAKANGGHVVELAEAPAKVVLTEEQAEIVEVARDATYPASYIYNYTNSHDCEENLLINAYVNGYTVEKKYLVYKVLVNKQKHEYFAQAYRSSVNPGTVSWFLNSKVQSESLAQFTEAEIEHYGLQDCERVESD